MHARWIVIQALALALAGSSSAFTISLNQVGGTAVGGVGQIGDTVIVSIDVSLDASDIATAVGVSLAWDLEGGDVLDIVLATEPDSVSLGGKNLVHINGRYRIGTPGEIGIAINSGDGFPASVAGPTAVTGWEQVVDLLSGDFSGVSGPGSFSMGTAEFVLREFGSTTLSFHFGNFYETIAAGPGFEIEGDIVFEDLELGTGFQVQSLSIQVIPEPSTQVLLGLGLVLLALARRRAGEHRA